MRGFGSMLYICTYTSIIIKISIINLFKKFNSRKIIMVGGRWRIANLCACLDAVLCRAVMGSGVSRIMFAIAAIARCGFVFDLICLMLNGYSTSDIPPTPPTCFFKRHFLPYCDWLHGGSVDQSALTTTIGHLVSEENTRTGLENDCWVSSSTTILVERSNLSIKAAPEIVAEVGKHHSTDS
jgi:hypothetical protein